MTTHYGTTKSSSRDGREHIVIVGTGWAGYNVSQKLDDKKFNITVISPQETSPYTPLLVRYPICYFPGPPRANHVSRRAQHAASSIFRLLKSP